MAAVCWMKSTCDGIAAGTADITKYVHVQHAKAGQMQLLHNHVLKSKVYGRCLNAQS
jgi:hypothetical protein